MSDSEGDIYILLTRGNYIVNYVVFIFSAIRKDLRMPFPSLSKPEIYSTKEDVCLYDSLIASLSEKEILVVFFLSE